MSDPREPVVYTAEVAGQILGKSKDWVEETARAGLLGYTKAGQTLLFMPEHLLAYLRANEVKPTATLESRRPRSRRPETPPVPALQSKPPRSRRKDMA